MKKKILMAVCALTAATAMTVGLAACNGMSAEEAEKKIATFTSTPTTVNATFNQTYQLKVNIDNPSVKSFEKDIADTVTIQADYTAGNLYYYGKRVAKDNSVVEQLVLKEGETYSYLTTYTAKKTLENEAAAKSKIDELMTSLSKQTAGYVNGGAFVYDGDWVHDYLLMGSGTIKGTESTYFTYKYDKAENDGLKVDIDMKYVGYFTDAGVSEFGTDDTHTGAAATIVTDSNGFITSFNQTLNNHLDMRITSTPWPLDLTGTRSLTASYNGTIEKKTTIDQTLNNPTVTFGSVENVTFNVFDFGSTTDMKKLNTGDSLAIGRKVAVMVTPADGYELGSVKINGEEAYKFGPCYCYDVTEDDYNAELKVEVSVKAKDADAPTTGTIVVDPANVTGCTIQTYDFTYSLNITPDSFKEGTTVAPGHFVAVKVTCESGYSVASVKINGSDAQAINDYYCVTSMPVVAGTTYTVVVTLTQS